MAYIVFDDNLGFIDLNIVDPAGPGPEAFAGSLAGTFGRFNAPGMELRGIDPNLGGGTFVFAQAAANVTQYNICELTQVVNAAKRYDVSAQHWAGAVNTGKALAVAMVALAQGQWGWFQVQGLAIANVSGAPAAGNPAYWQASGVVSPTGVASKQMVNCQFACAVSQDIGTGAGKLTMSATQALLLLNRPFAQGAIT